VLVHPLERITHIYMEPSSGGTFPATLEGYLQVFLLSVVVQHQPQARKHLTLIASRRIKISEETGVGWKYELAFTQHTKAIERCNSIWVQMDRCAPQIV
jgi:hypothetical protein